MTPCDTVPNIGVPVCAHDCGNLHVVMIVSACISSVLVFGFVHTYFMRRVTKSHQKAHPHAVQCSSLGKLHSHMFFISTNSEEKKSGTNFQCHISTLGFVKTKKIEKV